jgi:hypothetical protein
LQAEEFAHSYNSLLKHSDYSAMLMGIQSKQQEDSYKLALTLKTSTKKILASMQARDFSRLLLIINIFKISQVLKSYRDLYTFSLEQGDLKLAKVLLEIITLIRDFHAQVHTASLTHLQNNTVESLYMRCDIKNNKLSFLPIHIVDNKNIEKRSVKVLLERFSI